MTKWQRVNGILSALLSVLGAAFLIAAPDIGRILMVVCIGIAAVLKAVGKLFYYLTLARFMVGGKTILYRAFIYLDFGLFTLGVADIPEQYIMLYLVFGYLFYGGIGIMRAMEIRKSGGSWQFRMAMAVGNISLGILCLTQFGSEIATMHLLALGIIWSAAGKIITVFRRNAVLYVQQD